MVRVKALLVPPLLHPRSLEVPPGVCAVTLADPGAEIKAVVIVTCICWLLVTVVVTAVPLMTTTDAATK